MSQPYKTLLCLDFETRWDKTDYTLSKMTTEEYIRDPRFKAFGCCIHEVGSSAPTQWYSHAELPRIFKTYDWSKTAVLAHNAQFDVSIMSFIYGVKPCFIFDSLSMGRALRGVEVGNSLMKLAEDYGLPPKGRAVHSTDGLTELTPEIEQELAEYCKHDVYLCEEIFSRFMMRLEPDGTTHGAYPTKELRLIDMTLRMYIDPKLELDADMLQLALDEENKKLEIALLRADVEQAALASNEKFAEVLLKLGVEPPTKTSKTTGKEAFAFAKNDALFQSLLNGDNEDVALLCEARLRVKSTLERTRAQRFIDIAGRGALPVPLSYYGASVTGRWAAAKGSNINLQNMKRGSFLRKSIMAPDGYLLCVGDLSQIEPRVLAWLADYDDLLGIFRAGGDPYAEFGAPMFGVPGMTKESHPLLRQSSKSAMLGCFGRDTQVLTPNGYKAIVDIRSTDLLWDGLEWVRHEGLLQQGAQMTEIAYGVAATPEHRILVGSEWVEWHAAHTNPTLFKQALCSVNLPASTGVQELRPEGTSSTRRGCAAPAVTKGSLAPRASLAAGVSAALSAGLNKLYPLSSMGLRSRSLSKSGMCSENLPVPDGSQKTDAITHACCVVVGGKDSCTAQTYSKGHQLGAKSVQEKRESRLGGKHTDTTAYAPTAKADNACSTASARSLSAALTRVALRIQTTVVEASRSTLRGLQIALSSYATLSPSMVGINHNFNSTGATTNVDTNRATYASSHVRSTWLTNAESQHAKLSNCVGASPPLKQRMQTYDIAMAGPRNRYTILTDDGPIIVHNCGYQLGWASFAAQLLVGFLGAPPVRYGKKEAKQLGVTKQDVERFMGWPENVRKMKEIPHSCTEEELAVHCLASKAIIEKYRAAAAPVVDFWGLLGNLIEHSLLGGKEYDHKGVLFFSKERIEMANGMHIRYPDLRQEHDKEGRVQYTYTDGKKRVKLYPGKVCNNVTQGTARIVMSDGLLRVQKQYPVLGTVHDEGIILVPESDAGTALPWVLGQMTKEPTWMPGIPLAADGGIHKRYGMAKN